MPSHFLQEDVSFISTFGLCQVTEPSLDAKKRKVITNAFLSPKEKPGISVAETKCCLPGILSLKSLFLLVISLKISRIYLERLSSEVTGQFSVLVVLGEAPAVSFTEIPQKITRKK